MSLLPAAITAVASHFPARVRQNSYFYDELGLETNEEWILSRTGVRERRVADLAAGETCAVLASEAARRCLERRGLGADAVDAVLVATISGDLGFPATACLVQDRIGARQAFAFDISGACTGWLQALATAAAFVESGRARRVLAIGAETMSSILDFSDRNTCILFGDGAGAALVERVPESYPGRVLDCLLESDGGGARYLYRTGGGSRHRGEVPQGELRRSEMVTQDGRTVFKLAVQNITSVVRKLLERNGLGVGDLALVVPHQANIRIIDACVERLGVAPQRVAVCVDRYGNTTAATLPTTLDLALEQGRLARGDRFLFCTFGAGLTWGAALCRWGGTPID
jgi:3-oxoacyl-[acyl-carrier-protein] synthase-3